MEDGSSGPLQRRVLAFYFGGGLTNSDLLTWFSEDERAVCIYCRARASVALSEDSASFCLVCGAITLDGARLDVDARLPAG